MIPTSDDSVSASIDTGRQRRVLCPSCGGEKTVNNRNSEGHWYCRCLTCGCRFWHPDSQDA